jgi:hypothetical protein
VKIDGVEMGPVASFLIEAFPRLPPASQAHLLKRMREHLARREAAREAVRKSLRVIQGGRQG